MRHDLDTYGDLTLTIRVPRPAWRELIAALAKDLGTTIAAELKGRVPAAPVPGGRHAGEPVSASPVFVDAKQLAQLLSVSVGMVRLWAQRPGFPVVRFGRLIRFKVNEVLAWCESEAGAGRRHRRW